MILGAKFFLTLNILIDKQFLQILVMDPVSMVT